MALRTAAADIEEGSRPPLVKAAFEVKAKTSSLKEAAGIVTSSIPVPCNVYGGAAMCAMLHENETFSDWVETCGESYIRLLLNHVIQGMLMLGLAQLNTWQYQDIATAPGKQCYDIQIWFYIPCVWVFVASVLKEIIDTMDMCELFLFRVPTVEGKSQVFLYSTGANGSLSLASGGMSKVRKVFVSTFVLFPRLALAVLMLITGGTFLLSAGGNANLLMNCLAANFILDSDELIFSFLTPAKTQRLIASIPPFDSDQESSLQMILRKASFWIKLVVSCLTVLLMYVLGMPQCVLDPCEGAAALGFTCPIR